MKLPSPNGVLAITLVLAALFLVGAAFNLQAVRNASDAIARGEAEHLRQAVHTRLRLTSGPPRGSDLEELAEAEPSLRYVALLDRQGEVQVAWGTTAAPQSPPVLPGQSFVRVGAVYRLVDFPPEDGPPPRRARGSGRPPGPPFAPEDFEFDRGFDRLPPGAPVRPNVVIEFAPRTGEELAATARAILVASFAGAFLIAVAGFLLRRLLIDREKTQQRSFEEQRLRSLGEMSAVMAHEIRNPLASLKGNAQLLTEQLAEMESAGSGDRELRDRVVRKARRVVDEAVRLESLTSRLLDFVREARLEIEEVNVAEVVQHALDEMAAKGFDAMRFERPTVPIRWQLDPARMEQVFANLLENAVAASPAAGTVGVRIAKQEEHLVIDVEDLGPGVSPEMRDRLFDPFSTDRSDGTGLGLAVVRRIVELHGGTVTAANLEAGGARFRVRLPPTTPASTSSPTQANGSGA